MSSFHRHELINYTSPSTHRVYSGLPYDLTVSPSKTYFRDTFSSYDDDAFHETATAASSDDSILFRSQSMPIMIPGANQNKTDDRIAHNETTYQAQSVPDSFAEAAHYNGHSFLPLGQAYSYSRSPEIAKASFIVGSFVDTTPVPWPPHITRSHDGKHNRRLRQHKLASERDSIQEEDLFMFEKDQDD